MRNNEDKWSRLDDTFWDYYKIINFLSDENEDEVELEEILEID